jgi:predicted ATP-grasp superfamily ATP-dependent carboligase
MRYTTLAQTPTLRRPAMIVALEGWNDAGEAATNAVRFVASELGAEPIGQIDAEEFYDFQQTRPNVRLTEEGERRIDWPSVQIRVAYLEEADRDLVLVDGHEPNLRWRTFAGEVLAVAEELGVETLVTVGALLADVPHSRPVPVIGSTTDPSLAERYNLAPSTYEGPTGMLGVLGDAARRADVPVLSLWATLPHYVQGSPNPRATLAIVRKLADLIPLDVDTEPLEEEGRAFDSALAEILSEDTELTGYVERLEAETDQEPSPLADLPPEQFVAEVERYLRDHPGGGRP